MARALLRLRPDGIYEIVSQHRTRKMKSAAVALLAISVVAFITAAALSKLVGTARGIVSGASLAAFGFAGLLVRARLQSAARPLASTIRLRPARVPPLVPDTGGARDAGA